jgi:hypothetical protein
MVARDRSRREDIVLVVAANDAGSVLNDTVKYATSSST